MLKAAQSSGCQLQRSLNQETIAIAKGNETCVLSILVILAGNN